MSLPALKLRGYRGGRTTAGSGRTSAGAWRRRLVALGLLSAAVLAAAAYASQGTPAGAQAPAAQAGSAYAPCPPEMGIGQPFVQPPEIAAGADGTLRGKIILGSERRWMATRQPFTYTPPGQTTPVQDWAPADNSKSQCNTPHVRHFMAQDPVQFVMNEMGVVVSRPYPTPTPSAGNIPLPMPGPTLRARVGNLVQLAFLNLIDPDNFGNSFEGNAERSRGGGCDRTSVYPGAATTGDKYPDCFHGSSTGNIHFHGTHTNPNTTGDNVFIEVRPALRDNGKLVDSPDKTDKWFQEFFTRCEQQMSVGFGGGTFLKEWPTSWNDMPKGWTDYQLDQLKKYDEKVRDKYPKAANLPNLLEVDRNQLKQNAWPQYYVGSYPYCFRLPEYTAATWPPTAPTPTTTPTTGGAGTAELGHTGMGMGMGRIASGAGQEGRLLMGQSPGTHWYHAHKHGSTAINVANGMAGAFIIEGSYDDGLNAWYGKDWTRVQPVMVINQLGQAPNLMTGGGQDKGPDFSINGRLRPVVTMTAGEVQMFRIVNASGRAGVYFQGPPAGFQWKQIAQDGVQFSGGNYKNTPLPNLLLAAGNRADLLVKAPSASTPCANPGPDGGCLYAVMVKNIVDLTDLLPAKPPTPQKIRWITLFTINVKPDVNGLAAKYPNRTQFIPQDKYPTLPPFLKSITDEEVTGTKTVVFATGPGGGPAAPSMHTIDNKKFDGEVGEVVLLNTVEEWKVVNKSYPSTNVVSHPFHIHINPFQVTEVFDPNEQLIDPTTKKPVFAPDKFTPVLKYVFTRTPLRPGQCYLNPQDPETWKQMIWRPKSIGKPAGCTPLTAADFDADNIWWDVFPIPSGDEPTQTDPKTGKQVPILKLDPKTNQPVIDPKTGATVPVQVPGYFKMRSRFVDFPGFYVIHCHILAHEDRGMMTIVEVAPMRTPYSHH